MAAKVLPFKGQVYNGDIPQAVKWAHVRAAFAAAAGVDVVTGAVQALYALITIPAGLMILEIKTVVAVAWTASVTLTLGDTAGAAAWGASAQIAPQSAVTTGLMVSSLVATVATNAGGKFYASADSLGLTVAGANPAVGTLDVYMSYIENYLPLL